MTLESTVWHVLDHYKNLLELPGLKDGDRQSAEIFFQMTLEVGVERGVLAPPYERWFQRYMLDQQRKYGGGAV